MEQVLESYLKYWPGSILSRAQAYEVWENADCEQTQDEFFKMLSAARTHGIQEDQIRNIAAYLGIRSRLLAGSYLFGPRLFNSQVLKAIALLNGMTYSDQVAGLSAEDRLNSYPMDWTWQQILSSHERRVEQAESEARAFGGDTYDSKDYLQVAFQVCRELRSTGHSADSIFYGAYCGLLYELICPMKLREFDPDIGLTDEDFRSAWQE